MPFEKVHEDFMWTSYQNTAAPVNDNPHKIHANVDNALFQEHQQSILKWTIDHLEQNIDISELLPQFKIRHQHYPDPIRADMQELTCKLCYLLYHNITPDSDQAVIKETFDTLKVLASRTDDDNLKKEISTRVNNLETHVRFHTSNLGNPEYTGPTGFLGDELLAIHQRAYRETLAVERYRDGCQVVFYIDSDTFCQDLLVRFMHDLQEHIDSYAGARQQKVPHGDLATTFANLSIRIDSGTYTIDGKKMRLDHIDPLTTPKPVLHEIKFQQVQSDAIIQCLLKAGIIAAHENNPHPNNPFAIWHHLGGQYQRPSRQISKHHQNLADQVIKDAAAIAGGGNPPADTDTTVKDSALSITC